MLLSLGVLFFVLAIHPFTTYPASLYLLRAFGRRRPAAVADPAPAPTIAVCVPAYNEESVIVEKAENLLALQKTVPSCELLVYVDAASDRTAELLEPYRDRIDVVVGDARRGKSHGLNLLVARAKADILVFTDANVMLHPDALRRIAARFAAPEIGCVCGHLQYQNGGDSPTAASGNLYWKIEEVIRQLESDTVGIIGADGSLFATRRALHPVVPPDIIDDFFVSMKILLGGHAVVRAPDALAFERTGTDDREEFGRKVRIACQAFNVHRLLWAEIRAARFGLIYAYVSHRLLKWTIAYNLALACAFTLAALFHMLPFARVLEGLFAGLVLASVAWHFRIGPARQVGSILLAFAGAGWGVFRSLRGDRFQTWKPMSTVRMGTDAQH